MQSPAKGFSVLINSNIEIARDMVHHNFPTATPLLNGKMLNVNTVVRRQSGVGLACRVFIDHHKSHGGHNILIKWSGSGLGKAKLSKDRPELVPVPMNFASVNEVMVAVASLCLLDLCTRQQHHWQARRQKTRRQVIK
jgi:hypothetical protein